MFSKFKWLILAIFVILPNSALAITANSGELVVLEADKTVNGNYYAAGTTIEINGTVNGDLFLAGNTIVVDSENINGDIFAAGSNISIKGKVNGSLRLAGENIDVTAEVSRNIMSAGQNFRLGNDSKLNGHLTFWGQMLNVAGEVGRVEGAFSSFRLSGKVNNDVDVYLTDPVEQAINISDEANINGTLYYKAIKKEEINSKAAIGNISFNEIIKKKENKIDKGDVFSWLFKFFSMLVVGMIAIYMWPKFLSNSYGLVYKQPVKTFFKGLLLLLATPLASILIAITIIGVPVAIIVMLLWGMAIYLAKIMAAWFVGKFIKERFFSKAKWHKLSILALGIIVYMLVGKIYLIGPFVVFVIYTLAWGTFMNIFKFKKD